MGTQDHATYLASLPRQIVASAALIRDAQGRVCCVEPTYKKDWLLPGGTVEAGESPVAGCRREVQEELGLTLELGRLLLVDWVPLAGDPNGQLLFAYDGGVLTDEQIQRITLPDDELHSFRFVACESLGSYVRDRNVTRISAAMRVLADGGVAEVDRA